MVRKYPRSQRVCQKDGTESQRQIQISWKDWKFMGFDQKEKKLETEMNICKIYINCEIKR